MRHTVLEKKKKRKKLLKILQEKKPNQKEKKKKKATKTSSTMITEEKSPSGKLIEQKSGKIPFPKKKPRYVSLAELLSVSSSAFLT